MRWEERVALDMRVAVANRGERERKASKWGEGEERETAEAERERERETHYSRSLASLFNVVVSICCALALTKFCVGPGHFRHELTRDISSRARSRCVWQQVRLFGGVR